MKTRSWNTANPDELAQQLSAQERRISQLERPVSSNNAGLAPTMREAAEGSLAMVRDGLMAYEPAADIIAAATTGQDLSHDLLTQNNDANWTLAALNGGQVATGTPLINYPGIAEFWTATAAAASGYRISTSTTIVIAEGMRYECIFRTPAAFTTGTATNAGIWFMAGFHTRLTYAVGGAGIYAYYDSTGDLIAGFDNGTASTVTLATLAAASWYQLSIAVTANGATYKLYDGATGQQLATQMLSGALPTTAVRASLNMSTVAMDLAFLSSLVGLVDFVQLHIPPGPYRLGVAA